MSIRVGDLLAPLLWLLLCSSLLGLAPPATASESAVRGAVEAAAQSWIQACNAGNLDALLRLSSADVILLDPQLPPVSGRAAARQALSQAAPGVVFSTVTKEITVAGAIAWRIGTLTQTSVSGQVVNRGQSLEIWKRVQGAWQLHRHMSGNLLTPSAELQLPPSGPVLDAPRD